MSTRNVLSGLLKLSIVALLIGLIASQVSWHDYQVVTESGETLLKPGLASSLDGFRYQFFVAALLFQVLSAVVSSLRWHLLMLVQGIRMDRVRVLLLTLLGEFFNQLLPGAVGGDMAKAFYMIRHTGRKGATLVSIFVNRFAGLATLTFIAAGIVLALSVVGGQAFSTLRLPVFGIFVVAGLIGGFTILSLNEGLFKSVVLRRLLARLPFAVQIESVRVALHRYRKIGTLLLPIASYSLLIVVFYILSVMCVGLSLGITLPWYYYFLYIPLITIISSLPVTPGGIGVVEELFLYFLGAAGGENKILAMALFCRLVLILSAIPGAIIFMCSRRISRAEISRAVGELKIDQ